MDEKYSHMQKLSIAYACMQSNMPCPHLGKHISSRAYNIKGLPHGLAPKPGLGFTLLSTLFVFLNEIIITMFIEGSLFHL